MENQRWTMYSLRADLDDALTATGTSGAWLPDEPARTLARTLERRFAYPGTTRLWERVNAEGTLDPTGWHRAAKLVAHLNVVIVLDSQDETSAALRLHGSQLHAVLSETSPFVLYLTDDDGSFLICHNDHDVLIVIDPKQLLVEGTSSHTDIVD